MTIYYSYLLSLLFLLLITHWTDTASLRSYSPSSSKWSLDRRYPSLTVNSEVITTSEPILSRRRPLLISNERRKRWSIQADNDEIEIPINETNSFTTNNQSDDISSFNSTTISLTTEIKYPLLKQDSIEINQTDELTTNSLNEDISLNNNTNIEYTSSSTISNEITEFNSTTNITDINQQISNEIIEFNTTTNIIDINQETSNETNQSNITDNELETSSIPISVTQTIEETSTLDEFKQDTAIILMDFTTIPHVVIDDDQTSTDSEKEISSEYNTTIIPEEIGTSTIISDVTQNDTISIQEEIDNTTIISDTTQNNKDVIDQGIDVTDTTSNVIQNETSTMISDEEEYSNETMSLLSLTTVKPICDRSCQCSKECPYGFEIINDKCECDPPCKNYQCFGNDTCTLTKKGQPLCQPEKGNEHDRPIRCYQPRDSGYHDTDVQYDERWYYNPDQDTCHLFVYRGLGGNENNFQTLHECHVECITCAPSPNRGTCLGYIPMWYYDYQKNQCSQFNYSGCKGNENKFMRKQDCIDTCITRILNL